jgi:prevent-host-death family protein
MKPVQIAVLKNDLSGYLRRVRAGHEVVVLDRKTPVARIIPIKRDSDLEMQALIAEGILVPPAKPFDPAAFWSIGANVKRKPGTRAAIDRAVQWAREGVDVDSILGRKRARSRVRARTKK